MKSGFDKSQIQTNITFSVGENFKCFVAQWKRVGPITQRSEDQSLPKQLIPVGWSFWSYSEIVSRPTIVGNNWGRTNCDHPGFSSVGRAFDCSCNKYRTVTGSIPVNQSKFWSNSVVGYHNRF